MVNDNSTVDRQPSGGTLGTFTGVFTPSILTILGIILFLRLGFSVGNAGLVKGLVIIGIATAVSALTSISLAAIATNIEVKGGGDYYMISRTIGAEFGGAIGIVLFLAQSVSIGFYTIGFGEALSAIVGLDQSWAPQVIALGAIALLFVFAWAGADVATRFQFVVMIALIAALGSFYLGAIPGFDGGLVREGLSAPAGALSFWAVFAIFFPAVTGFTQGVSMSGDLRDPVRSLPIGTFAAVGISTIVYISVAVLMAGNATGSELIDDPGVMGRISAFGPLIDIGVVAATLSSAMASFLGGPRILQSLASDKIFPFLSYFAVGHGPTSNPRRGVLLSSVIAITTVGLGSLNVIAPVVSMFFLISYGLLNYATYYEARAASPSFRPRFRYFNKWASLAGAVACLGVMLAINPVAGLGSVAVMLAIHQYLHRADRPDRWADASRSFYFQRAKESISAMRGESAHARSWRPQILAFSRDPERRERLLRFATWLEGESGLTAAVEIMVGEGAIKRREAAESEADLQAQIEQLGLDIHGRVILAADALEALPVVVQAFGLGPLRANTALFGWSENPSEQYLQGYMTTIREVMRHGIHVVSLSSDAQHWSATENLPEKARRIDVYWQEDDASRLALLGAYLFTRTSAWSRATIRLIGLAEDPHVADGVRGALTEMLHEVRISAEVDTVVDISETTLAAASRGSALVLLPMRLRRTDIEGPFGTDLRKLVALMPLSASILAGAPFELNTHPESGSHTELVLAEERAEVATKRLSALVTQLERIDSEVADLQARLVSGQNSETASLLADAEARLETVNRRVLSARARAETATEEVQRIIAGASNGSGASGGNVP